MSSSLTLLPDSAELCEALGQVFTPLVRLKLLESLSEQQVERVLAACGPASPSEVKDAHARLLLRLSEAFSSAELQRIQALLEALLHMVAPEVIEQWVQPRLPAHWSLSDDGELRLAAETAEKPPPAAEPLENTGIIPSRQQRFQQIRAARLKRLKDWNVP